MNKDEILSTIVLFDFNRIMIMAKASNHGWKIFCQTVWNGIFRGTQVFSPDKFFDCKSDNLVWEAEKLDQNFEYILYQLMDR